uniref:NADH dehydrogenase subunit 2 n=1 Tax=Paruterina candelabraria TaxID=2364639 RepID=A0A386HV62_9CEST|nr:NADH dehydrogenase subunit 2 [Paruterina candelabraria]AYD49583.1 NADH dehydrogenase subunit 2 [Paruterina candelabraria]
MFGRFFVDSFLFSFVFSIFFCILCSLVDNMFGFWIFLELCGLSIIPSFFYSIDVSIYGVYSSILSYVVMSSLSSVFMVSGILFSSLYYYIFWGFVVKFGLFPFSFWVYRVFSCSNWLFIFLLSVVMKFPVLFFCFLYQTMVNLYIVYVDCFFTILMCSFFIWFLSISWEYIWCHISLSSISTLVVACFCSDVVLCFVIYLYYFIWGTCCIIYFNSMNDCNDLKSNFWYFCFLLLVTPISFPVIYKFGVCIAIISSSVYLLLVWCIYSFSEQFFLYKLASDYFYSDVCNSWLS